MNQTSSAITGGIAMTAAGLSPLVSWAFNGFTQPVPDNVPLIISAGLIAASHFAINVVNTWMDSKKKSSEAPVEVQPTEKAAP